MMTAKQIIFGFVVAAFALAARADDDNLSSEFQKLVGNTNPAQEDWSLHGQATDIIQGYPAFSASYSGANSLSSDAQWKNNATSTLFLGRKLWQGAEVYIDPELYEGKELSNDFGVAGFPNGEATGQSYDFKYGFAEMFIRQVIGLGGPTEAIAAEQNQLATTEDISRITITAGKIAVTDIFDNNSYAHDPRTQFLNWALADSAAWNLPTDMRGYTRGGVIDFNQENWALRYGMFIEPASLGGNDLVYHGLNNVAQVAELEERYKIADNPGKTRFLIFYNRNREADYTDALGATDVNTAIANANSYGGVKYGFAINSEQQLADGIGAFARLSWNDGKTEEWMFTDVTESAAAGLSLDGKRWGQAGDTWGIAAVINGISPDQRKFLEQGGMGIVVGDGNLSYSPEMIFETYYLIKITQYAAVSPDYQFIANPGYNNARGPVNVFAVRFHAGF